MPEHNIDIRNLTIEYPDSSQSVLNGLSVILKSEKWNVLLGKSGSGKTTLLRYLAGLLPEKVRIDGGLSNHELKAYQTNIAYMAQQDNLLPWLTVVDNVLLPLRISQQDISPSIFSKATDLLNRLGLGNVVTKLPEHLSGGMRQRVALARTLIQDKPIVLMDEPFSALDAVTRHDLQALSYSLLTNRTVLLVTHDPHEACRLGEHIYLMNPLGTELTELDTPKSIVPRAQSQEVSDLQAKIYTELGANYV